MTFYSFIKALVLPPACLLLALVGALLVARRWRKLGLGLLGTVILVFYLLSAPFVANALVRFVATIPPLPTTADTASAQAIVVLSAGALASGMEYGRDTAIDQATAERLRYGAFLHRRTQLPILVSGGAQRGVAQTLADAMKLSLEQDFGQFGYEQL